MSFSSFRRSARDRVSSYRITRLSRKRKRLSHAPSLSQGVTLTGLMDAPIGVGRIADGLCSALQSMQIPLHTQRVRWNRSTTPLIDGASEGNGSPTQIFCVQPDSFLPVLQSLPPFAQPTWNIAAWSWELDRIPDWWKGIASYVDELWVPSDYIAHACSSLSLPIRVIPPVIIGHQASANRKKFGIPEGSCAVLSLCDSQSNLDRKNPFDSIRAFQKAFQSDEHVTLLIKILRAEEESNDMHTLHAMIAHDPRIRLLTELLEPEEMHALYASCDVLLSLHRAEGVGIPMVEAPLHGCAVIATRNGGFTEVLDEHAAWLIPGSSVTIGMGQWPYPASAHWMQPDIDAAAHALREAFLHPDMRHHKVRHARESVTKKLSLHAAVDAIAKR